MTLTVFIIDTSAATDAGFLRFKQIGLRVNGPLYGRTPEMRYAHGCNRRPSDQMQRDSFT